MTMSVARMEKFIFSIMTFISLHESSALANSGTLAQTLAKASSKDRSVVVEEPEPTPANSVSDIWVASLTEAVVTLGIFAIASAVLRRRRGRNSSRTKAVSSNAQLAVPTSPSSPMSPAVPKKVTTSKRPPDTTSLVTAVRAGRADELPNLLDAAYARAQRRTQNEAELEEACTQLLLSSLRACAAERQFRHGLVAFRHVKDRIGRGCQDLWSMLLYTVVEAGEFDLCQACYRRICVVGAPMGYDHVNMVRSFAHRQDLQGLKRMLDGMCSMDMALDALSRNKALSACVAKGAIDLAELLMCHEACSQDLDCIAFSTLMKGYSRIGQKQRCFELKTEMQEKGVAPSAVTYGILLEVCVHYKDMDSARGIFREMQTSNLVFNAVHCTSFMKGLVSVGLVDDAAEMLSQMHRRTGAEPDLISYTTVLRAYGERGRTAEQLQLIEQMLRHKVKPDEIAYHAVLDGCCNAPLGGGDVLELLENLIELGLQPSTPTFSIVLKALARSKAFEAAIDFLEGAWHRFGDPAKRPRLFLQLGQACIKASQEATAVRAYQAFLRLRAMEGEEADGWVAQQMIRTCLGQGSVGTASIISLEAQRAGGTFPPWVAKALQDEGELLLRQPEMAH